jgi:hypothetical protein
MKRARTCRKTDYRMKRARTCRKTDYRMKRARTCRKTDYTMNEAVEIIRQKAALMLFSYFFLTDLVVEYPPLTPLFHYIFKCFFFKKATTLL